MSDNTIKCPKCNGSKILLTEVAEINSSYVYKDGKFISRKNEHITDILRYEGSCLNDKCNHEWIFEYDIVFQSIPIEINDENIIEFNCVTCGEHSKQIIKNYKNFNPEKEECIYCKTKI